MLRIAQGMTWLVEYEAQDIGWVEDVKVVDVGVVRYDLGGGRSTCSY